MPRAEGTPKRTQVEIATFLKAESGGFLNFVPEALIEFLDYEHAEPFLKDGISAEDWEKDRVQPAGTDARCVELITAYMAENGWDKALGHRGISASRTIQKIGAWLWLLNRGDLYERFLATNYPQYGVPMLVLVCKELGLPMPIERDAKRIERMARGLPCEPGCENGCGQ